MVSGDTHLARGQRLVLRCRPMVDRLTPERRSANMRAIRGRDTKPEIQVRQTLHRMGFRYRLHIKDVPGRPDIAFKSRRKAIFVHGCFWHSHPGCAKAYRPKSRLDFWDAKLARNQTRDAEVQNALSAIGWTSLIVWECEVVDREQLGNKLERFLEGSSVAQGRHD